MRPARCNKYVDGAAIEARPRRNQAHQVTPKATGTAPVASLRDHSIEYCSHPYHYRAKEPST
jgi:hypothetical protein